MGSIFIDNAGYSPNFTTVTASQTLADWSRELYNVDASAGNITLTLPLMRQNVNDGRIAIHRVDNIIANTITIQPNPGQILNGITNGTVILNQQDQRMEFIHASGKCYSKIWLLQTGTNITVPGKINTNAITINNSPTNSTDATNKAYVDATVSGGQVSQWRGTWNGNGSLFPTTGGSGASGAINAGDYWDVPVTYSYPSVAPNTTIYAPNSIRALTLNPGQNPNYWFITENSLLRSAGDYDTFPTKTSPIGADTLLIEDSANSENKAEITLASLPVSTATQTAINNAVMSGQNWQGTWNGAGSLYPTTRPSGSAIQAGDIFTVSVTYTYSGTTIYQTTTLRALTNSPGQTASNWANEGEPTNKQDKIPTATTDNIATWDNAGNTKDSGIAISSIPTTTTNTKGIYVASNGNDTTGNGSILKPYLTLQKAESVVAANGFVYIMDSATYTGNITATVSNVTYTCLGSLNNNKIAYMSYTGTITIPTGVTGRAFQGITFAPGANQAIVHNSNNGTLNIDKCTFNGTNANIVTMAANINNNAVNWITNSDFTNATGNVNLADNTNNIAFTATITAGSNILTSTSIDTSGLPASYTLTAPGLQPGTVVTQRLTSTTVQINYPALTSSSGSITIYHSVSHFMNNNTALKLNIGLGQLVFGYNNFRITVTGNSGNYIDTSKTPIIPFANLTALYAQNSLTFGGVGSIAEVINDPTTTNNGLWQCVALPYSTATNWIQISQATVAASLPSASPTNLYADKTIGNDTTGNGSEAYPYATLTQAISSATTSPSVINLTSNTIFTDTITWTSSKTNITIQGNNFSETGGTQTLSGQQTFGSGSRYNNYINTYHSTSSNASFAFSSGALCSNVFKNITIASTATDWLGLNVGISNYIRLNNIAFQTNGINAINLPAFTNSFTMYIDQQDLFKGALLFTGTGAATTNIVIDSKVADGQVRLPSTYVGNIIWGSKSFGGTLGSSAHPIGIVTTQSDLTAILNWTTDTTYDGYYAITGFTPTSFTAGAIFGKQTAAGIATNLWWARTPAYNPSAVRDSTTTYQFKQSTNTWSVVGSGSGSTYNSLLTTITTAMLSTDTTLSVASTNGFASSGIIYITDGTTNNESISYTGKTATTFTGLTRGINGTTAAAHAIGMFVTNLGLPYPNLGTGASTTIGNIYAYAGSTAPYGTFICDGTAYSRSTYPGLFAVIGTAYGAGDGSTTFNVPDLRGRFIRGISGTSTNDPDAASRIASNTGGNTGNQIGSLQADNFASHTHTYTNHSYNPGGANPGLTTSPYSTDQSINTGATGGSETRPKNLYANYIIVWNTPAGNGDMYLANNNTTTGNNTHQGTETFNSTVNLNNLPVATLGNFNLLGIDNSDILKTQPVNFPVNLFTNLTASMLATDTTAIVNSTAAFPSSGVIYIDNEAISYTGKTATTFTGLTRGSNGSTAATHNNGAAVTNIGAPYPIGNTSTNVTIGFIYSYSGSTVPSGFLLCDGTTYSRTGYPSLFAVIGTSYGAGDGSTTFNVPDLRGYYLRGVDGTAGRDPDKATRTAMNSGGNTGNQIGSVQVDAFASHTHTYNQGSALSTQAQGGTGSASNYGYTNTSTNTGATGGNETRGKNAYCNFIICYNSIPGSGDVYQANNNAFTGNNTFAGTSTFNNSLIIPSTQATGTFSPIVRQTSDGSLKLQPPASSISYNAIAYQSAPPTSPNVNDTYIVQPTGTGAWAGQNNAIATWNGSAWGFYTPNNNDIASLINGTVYQYSSSTSSWSIYTLSGGAYTLLNVNTSLTLPGWQIMALVNATNNVVVTLPAVSNSNTTQQIIVKRIDNNTNYTVSIVPSGSQTIELTSVVYLYAQNDSIEITSNGASNAFISADNRNSGGTGTKSYLQSYVVQQTTGIANGSPILYNNNPGTAPLQSYGTNIQQLSNGQFLLQAGNTYRLSATPGEIDGTAAVISAQWYNVTTSSYITTGNSCLVISDNGTYGSGSNPNAVAIITPSVNTTVQLNLTQVSNTTIIGTMGSSRFGNAYIEQISTPTNVVNTTSYLSAFATTTQTLNTVGQTLSFGNTLSGSNITFDGTTATLIGGKTYWLEFNPLVVSSGANLSVQWYNVTTGSYFGQTILIYQSNVYANPLRFPITFTQNTQIQLKVVGPITSSGSLGDGSRGIYPVINIHQIGTTPVVISGNTAPQFAKNVTGTSCRGIVFIAKNQLWQMGYYTGSGSSTNATANCTIPTIVPINNSGAAIAGWSDVAYSYDSAIALTNDGRVFFWGYNTIAGAFQPIATLVSGLTGITISKVYCSTNKGNATSNSFFCISSTGAVYSFGDNSWGQLGIGNTTSTNTATLINTVISGKIITKISVSGNGAIHVGAIDSTGQLYTWGYGAQGTTPTCNPLGSGVANTNSSVPIAISGFTNVTDVWAASEYTSSSGANNFTRVLRSDGSSWASGNNSTGQLATGNTTSSSSFVRESLNKTNISAIYAYETYNGGCSIIIDTAGILYFSGNNNDACFGDGSTNNSAHTSFTNTTQLTNAGFQGKMIIGTAGIQPKVLMMGTANGGYNTCVVLDNTGTVWAAGRYQEGQTSNPNSSTTTAFLSAIAGTKGVPIIDIKASGLNGVDQGLIMLFQDGTIMSAGINTSGALGNETVPSNVMVAYGRHVIGYSG
jgi:microcystin-dependent protein/alpha-tubulin suppressor-like RCC1 family protein